MATASQQKEHAIDKRLPALWHASDVAQILGISVKTVHKLVREKKLACVQVTSRDRRFTDEQVREYIRSQSTELRVDKKDPRPVQSRPKKGGDRKSVGLSRTDLREEMRSWR
jgi:excisionase family DNA binding protein